MTPYFEKDGCTIYHGDCRSILPTLDPVDLVLTDPPYGVNGGSGGDAKAFKKAAYVGDWADTPEYIESVCAEVVRDLLPTVRCAAVTPGVRCMDIYPKPADIGCFWTPAGSTHGPWGFQAFHPILYYGKDWRAGRGALPSGVAVTERAEKNGHPCPKPIKAWKWLADKVSKEGDTILDPFMGSGTTLVAARDLGRKAIGIEIEEKYCEIAARRLAQEVLF